MFVNFFFSQGFPFAQFCTTFNPNQTCKKTELKVLHSAAASTHVVRPTSEVVYSYNANTPLHTGTEYKSSVFSSLPVSSSNSANVTSVQTERGKYECWAGGRSPPNQPMISSAVRMWTAGAGGAHGFNGAQ